MNPSQDLQIAISVAMSEAARRGHEFAGLEHLLFALLFDDDVARTVRHAGGDVEKLRGRLDGYLEGDEIPESIQQAAGPLPTRGFRRVMARAAGQARGAGKDELTTTAVLVAIFEEEDSPALSFLEGEGLTRLAVVSYLAHGASRPGGSRGEYGGQGRPGPHGSPAEGDEEDAPSPGSPEEALRAFTTDLTALARDGRIDPIIGRGMEIERTLRILQRRRKNNPVFVGDPGVGKTALVEGLAIRLAEDRVPKQLRGSTVHRLDLGGMLAGTRYRGDFESRIKAVLEALSRREGAILFVDEIHTLVGAGATGTGSVDASNLIKPALENGTLRCIGATTWNEYRQHFERDRALARRFQKVEVNEPSSEEAVRILWGLRDRYEEHHGIRYTRASLERAVDLAARHLRDSRLPDKAIDLMDEAGSSAALAGRRRVESRHIEEALSTMARIPAKRLKGDDRDRIRDLHERLKSVIFGQDQAVERVVSAIKVSRAGLGRPERPIGCFLMTGPTGCGKTELARQLSEALGIGFLRFDMSEYMERHSVARLVGAPPGYVGYDRGGLLTEAVSQTPHAVLLLDEIEKAHPDVFNILLQVMDHGTLTDTNGKEADFRQTILLMSSNVGARELERKPVGFEAGTGDGAARQAYEQLFSPEFRNRLDARVTFNPLSSEVMARIVDKFVDELRGQLQDSRVKLDLTDAARRKLAELGHDPKFGARPLGRVIDERIKRPLTDEILFGRLQDGGRVKVVLRGGELAFDFPEPETRD
jgi:ATP-dependent Clp protease ATP-binding subunit ClpA